MEDVRHVNYISIDDELYCHRHGDIVKFDGPFIDSQCWTCPLWAGLTEGFGVSCVYDDPGAHKDVLIYKKPNVAKAEAPEPTDDLNSIASEDGIAANESRLKLVDPERLGQGPKTVEIDEDEDEDNEEETDDDTEEESEQEEEPEEKEESDEKSSSDDSADEAGSSNEDAGLSDEELQEILEKIDNDEEADEEAPEKDDKK